MISVKKLNKTFKVSKKKAGVLSALKSFIKPEYELVQALKDVSFEISKGEIIGYIGPNGAGKSTTIKVMSGILTPDNGQCIINGKTPWQDRINHVKNIGVVFGQRSQLWWDIPVIDSFNLLKDIYKINDQDFHQTLDLLKETLSIQDFINVPVRQLSLGQRMRCEIAASLLHSPDILFLDEPTIGLDAVSKVAVRDFIKEINAKKNTTVILTTHDMSDIEALADRVILIGKGQVLFDGHLKSIRDKYVTHKTITIDHHVSDYKITYPGVDIIESDKDRLVLSVNLKQVKVSDLITYLARHFDIIDMTVEDPSVDDIIIDMYKEFKI